MVRTTVKSQPKPPATPRMRVFKWLEHAIESGDIPPGEAIPSERALAKLLGVAQNTAAAAIDEAEARGLVVRRCPTARKRFVPVSAQAENMANASIYVLGELYPYAPADSKAASILAPRWSMRSLSIELLARLSATGKHVTVLNAETLDEEGVDAIFRAPPAAMLITATVNGNAVAMRALEHCRAAAIPVVVYGNSSDLRGFDRVYSDHRAGSRALTEWLLARGCRRIVPFFPYLKGRYWEQERLDGYADALRAAGLKPSPCEPFAFYDVNRLQLPERFKVLKSMAIAKLLELGFGRDATANAECRMQNAECTMHDAQCTMHNGPDALLCLTDNFARVAIAAMRELGLAPHRDILVAGYDNIASGTELGAFESEAPDVTIDKHNERTAAEMAALLAARLAGELPPAPQCRAHEFELVEREGAAVGHRNQSPADGSSLTA